MLLQFDSPVSFHFFYVATEKFKITEVVRVILPLDSAALQLLFAPIIYYSTIFWLLVLHRWCFPNSEMTVNGMRHSTISSRILVWFPSLSLASAGKKGPVPEDELLNTMK